MHAHHHMNPFTMQSSITQWTACSMAQGSGRRRLRLPMVFAGRFGEPPLTAAGTAAGDSNRVEDYLRSPFDLAVFGPRLALGALLSTRETLRNLQSDVQRASAILQDPRTAQEKRQVVQQELEQRLTNYLQRGAAVEAEVLTTATAFLPEDVKQQLPQQLKDILFRRNSNSRATPTPPIVEEPQFVPIATVAKTQTAAELGDLQGSVAGLRQALADLRTNVDPTQDGVLRVNARDARISLKRRMQQLSPAARSLTDAPVQAAIEEADLLLKEVDAFKL